MRIAVTSQNFRTITGHAGKTTHFLVFDASPDAPLEAARELALPPELMMHAFRGQADHPLRHVDAIITGGCGEGFVRRLGAWGVRVAVTGEADPAVAVQAFLRGELAAPAPGDDHGHHHHGHGGCGGCGHD
jgi:predicted Fe-Mo cluster-binding NifX family protein